jgi:putative ABC transport system permease protein
MKPSWRKVLADLWGNKLRSLLVVASIAVGVFAIGVIAGAYVIIPQDLNVAYAAVNPAGVDLVTDAFPLELVDSVRRLAGVREAEGRRAIQVRVRRADAHSGWDTMTLVVIPDWERSQINRLAAIDGAAVAGDRQVVLEAKTMGLLGVTLGDALEIELPNGALRSLPIVGAVQESSDPYGAVLGNLKGFVTLGSLGWLHQPETLNQLYITVDEHPNDRDHLQAMADAVRVHLQRDGRTVRRTQVSPRNRHPLASIVTALLGVLGLLGGLIVFLSSSLIANTMSALLSQHLRQIGVMKLVGATRRQVVLRYLAMILIFSAAALTIAIPLGMTGARGLSALVADILNFPLRGYRPVPLAVALQVAVALLAPTAAGLAPVTSGARVSVHRAIGGEGLASKPSRRSGIEHALNRARWISRPLLISLRNTFRRKRRLALTLLTLSLGGAVFISVFNARVALDRKVEEVERYFKADVNLDLLRPYRIDRITALALDVPGVRAVEVWAATLGELLRPDGSVAESITILAPPADSASVQPIVMQGRWLLPEDENAIAISDVFWRDYPHLRAGDTLRLKVAGKERDWTVVGILQYTETDYLIAYANYPYVAGLFGETHQSTMYRLITDPHDEATQQRVAAALYARLDEAGIAVSQVEAGAAFSKSLTNALGILTLVLLMMALLTALVGSIGLMGTMSMNVMERTREIGIMRAIGAHDGIVARLVIVEGLTIGGLSFIIAGVLSFPISTALSNIISQSIFRSPSRFSVAWQGFALWFMVVGLLSVLASLWPARNATRLTIREVLAYE